MTITVLLELKVNESKKKPHTHTLSVGRYVIK